MTRKDFINNVVTYLQTQLGSTYVVRYAMPTVSEETWDNFSQKEIHLYSAGFTTYNKQNPHLRKNKIGMMVYQKNDGDVFGKDGMDLLEDILEIIEPLLHRYGEVHGVPISLIFSDGQSVESGNVDESLYQALLIFEYLGVQYIPTIE